MVTKEEIFASVKEYMAQQKDEFVPGKSKVTVGWPVFGHEEINSALDSLLDVWISQGPKVKAFEKSYGVYVGTKHGIAVNSGSSANLLAIATLLHTGRVLAGSEVIVPAATFTTVVSPIIQLGLTPVFVDVDPKTYNIDPAKIEAAITEKTGLIMPVHSLGCPADMHAIMEIAKRHNLPVFEDCCEAHSATIDGKVVGSFGAMGAYSFFVAHNMTSGEGGMIMTNDDELAVTARSMREFGRLIEYEPGQPRFYYTDEQLKEYDERYVFTLMGYNVRMTDVHASLGIEQLKKLDAMNKTRVANATFFSEELRKYEQYLQLPTTPEGMFHSFYGYTILVKPDAPFSRADIVRFLEERNVETRAFMGGNLAMQPAYRNEQTRVADDLAVTNLLTNNAFFIGCHPKITKEARGYAVKVFHEFFAQLER